MRYLIKPRYKKLTKNNQVIVDAVSKFDATLQFTGYNLRSQWLPDTIEESFDYNGQKYCIVAMPQLTIVKE